MGDSKKKCCKYKVGDKYCNLCMEEKLTIDSLNNPNELLKQRLQILNTCQHKKVGFWVEKSQFILLSFIH